MTDHGSRRALEGLKVLDLSFYAPGRAASLVLADLGADVICVEMPRGVRPEASYLDDDQSVRWLLYQRNKRSITLNLKTEGGQRVLRRLAEEVDVVIESYKPGTAAKLGADYESLKSINPRIVYASVSGFGQTGPYRHVVGHEPNYQGLGLALGQNRLDGQPPTVLSALVGDIASGANNALIGLLAALWDRERSGEGQHIDVSIAAGLLPLMGALPYAQWTRDAFRGVHFSSGLRADFRAYETKDGKYVAISPSEPWLWRRFCSAIGREDLVEYKPEHNPSAEARHALIEELSAVFRSRTRAEWTELNDRENIAVTAVLDDIREVEEHPQVRHRQQIAEIEYEPMGTVKQVKLGFQMSRSPADVRWMPRYGQHTDEVFSELGFADQITTLRAEGVCE